RQRDLDAERARRGIGDRRDVAHDAFENLAVDELRAARRADRDLADLALADLADRDQRIDVGDSADRIPDPDVVAELDVALLEHAVERRGDRSAREIEPRA